MKKKTQIHFILIKDLSAPAANILKQDALRVGAELVTAEGVVDASAARSNALLMATSEQLARLADKEAKQDFGLKKLAAFLRTASAPAQDWPFLAGGRPKLMAVLNLNEDSFYAPSRTSQAQARLEGLLEEGADFIDIGAVSSRPGSRYPGAAEEFARLQKTLDLIYEKKYFEQVAFSLDSFDERCLEYALDRGFKIINDISGLKNEKLASLAVRYDAAYILMHMQNSPENMQDAPHYEELLLEIELFFRERIAKLDALGVKKIILDPGIGFGKSPAHNLILIKQLGHFATLGQPLLIGASRKSVIDAYSPAPPQDRLAGTLLLHQEAVANGASILRVHDLAAHRQFFALAGALGEALL